MLDRFIEEERKSRNDAESCFERRVSSRMECGREMRQTDESWSPSFDLDGFNARS